MEKIPDIRSKLFEAGLKATHPRIVVLEALTNSREHPSAELIYDEIRVDNPSISLGSVYRVLDVLVEVGLIRRVSVKYGSKRYDADLNPHGHIYCLKTDRIQDYYDEELNELINNFFKKKKIRNLKIKEIKLQITGERIDPESDVTII